VEPHHDISICPHGGDVVAASVRHAGPGQPFQEGLEVSGGVGAADQGFGALEYRPEGEKLLG